MNYPYLPTGLSHFRAFVDQGEFVDAIVRRYHIDHGSAERLRDMVRDLHWLRHCLATAPAYVQRAPASKRAIAARLRQLQREGDQSADRGVDGWYPPFSSPVWIYEVANDEPRLRAPGVVD